LNTVENKTLDVWKVTLHGSNFGWGN